MTIASASSSSAAAFVEESRRQREGLQENQRKRNQTSEPKPARPLVKSKPSDRRGKRPTQPEEQLPSKSRRGKLTTESFAVSAAPFVDAEASSSSAAQPAPTQCVHLKRVMYQLKMELKKFKDEFCYFGASCKYKDSSCKKNHENTPTRIRGSRRRRNLDTSLATVLAARPSDTRRKTCMIICIVLVFLRVIL